MVNSKVLAAKIPIDIYADIKERVRLGLFTTESDVIGKALRKAFAEEAREFLRKLARSMKVSKKSLLTEWKKIRN